MNTEQLLQEIKNKDRGLRTSMIVFVSLLVLLILVGIAIGYQTLQKTQTVLQGVQNQQTQLTQAVQDLKDNNNTQLQKANAHLDCIALFFATPNRLNKTLDGCDVQVTPPLAPQASSGVNSKPVTVSPQVSQSQPSTAPSKAPSPSGLQKAVDMVSQVLNNLGRSL